jgi:hypothetical protein
MGYLQSLITSRVTPDGINGEMLRDLSKVEASKLIDKMLGQPFVTNAGLIPDDIPDGRYAFIEDKVARFYRVTTDKRNNRKVQRVLGAPGDFRYMPIPRTEAQKVITIIKDDPALHSQLFGHVVGACGVCGSPLTDPESIELGIGPICAGKMAW